MLTGDHLATARAIAVQASTTRYLYLSCLQMSLGWYHPSQPRFDVHGDEGCYGRHRRPVGVKVVAPAHSHLVSSRFDRLTDAEIDALPLLPLVIARCAPHSKVRMVEALHRRGLFCAMSTSFDYF